MTKPITPEWYADMALAIRYDAMTGKLYWRIQAAKNIKPGAVAGGPSRCGKYLQFMFRGQFIAAHRAIWFICTGEILPKDVPLDHINRDGFDNRIENLRKCTTRQNNHNTRPHRYAKSIYKGVGKTRYTIKKWCAVISIDGRRTYLGGFKTEAEAALAYDTAALKLNGEFAYLNFPEARRG